MGRGGAPTILAFGNPNFTNPAVAPVAIPQLPNSGREVEALRVLYGPSNSRIFIGEQATEARARALAGDYGILHFATHGFYDNRRPLYSHVMFSKSGASGDGLLEAWEIMDLKLQADLAVLSACDSNRGRVSAGEGMIGLTWAFFVAGCPATVASQWAVDSAGTTALMLAFHRQLRKEGKSGPEALRQASLELMRSPRFRHPFYWAPFIFVGAAGPGSAK